MRVPGGFPQASACQKVNVNQTIQIIISKLAKPVVDPLHQVSHAALTSSVFPIDTRARGYVLHAKTRVGNRLLRERTISCAQD